MPKGTRRTQPNPAEDRRREAPGAEQNPQAQEMQPIRMPAELAQRADIRNAGSMPGAMPQGMPQRSMMPDGMQRPPMPANMAAQRGLQGIMAPGSRPMQPGMMQQPAPQQAEGGPQPVPGGVGPVPPLADGSSGSGSTVDASRMDGLQEETRQQTGITTEKLRDAEMLLMEYRNGKASVDNRIIAAQEWWRLHNWPEIQRTRGTRGATARKSATAWLWNCIVGKHADAIDCYPEPIILPRMQDDKKEAQMLSDVVPVVMEMNDFEETYSLCQWQKMQEGTGGYGIFWDKTKLNGLGDISIQKINLLNLFWQPDINDIQDSPNLFYVTILENETLEEMYPELKGRLKNLTISIAEYQRQDSRGSKSRSAVVDWYYKKWVNGRRVLHYCKFVGDIILYSTENNGETRGLYDDGLYPFVLDPLYPVEGNPTGYGYIDIGRDAQADIDTLNQAMVQSAVVNSTPRHFIRKDGGVNEDEFADWSKPFVHVNGQLGEDSIRQVQTQTMDGMALNMLQQKIDELKFVTGNTDVQNGGTPTGVTAASAIAALKEDAGRSSKDSTKAAYRAYAKIVRMVIERIRQFYDIPRQFRILGETGQEKFVDYSNRGITPQPVPGGLGLEDGYRLPVFDIEVRAQRENAYTKMSQNELALQFLQLGFFNPQMTDQALMAIDMMEFKGKEELTQKLQTMGTMAQRAQQLGQVAMTLAQTYEPQLQPQLEQLIAMTTGGQVPQQPAGGAPVNLSTGGDNTMDPGRAQKENPIVTKARERAANASRPN